MQQYQNSIPNPFGGQLQNSVQNEMKWNISVNS